MAGAVWFRRLVALGVKKMNRNLQRVVITGCGAVSPFGLGVPTLRDHLWAGDSATRLIPEWRQIAGMKCHIAAPVPELDVKALLPRTLRRTMGKMAMYATLASKEALEDSGLTEREYQAQETGVVIGSTTGSPAAYEEFYRNVFSETGFSGIKSGQFFKLMGHSCAANVCLALGLQGEQWAPASACTSSSQALGLGYLLIQSGRQRFALCGGAEEVHPSVSGIFDLLRVASRGDDNPQQACRPFDVHRDGVVCGGGSGILVLESFQSAQARGAKIYGEIVGFGNVTDSGHIANPDKNSMSRAMFAALREGGLRAEEVDYVNAHATATAQGDIAEAAAIAAVVGKDVPVSSFKGHLGHALGAAGALELIAVLSMMKEQEFLPTRNMEELDPLCAVARIEKKRRPLRIRTVLKNNFALGGVNTSIAIRKV